MTDISKYILFQPDRTIFEYFIYSLIEQFEKLKEDFQLVYNRWRTLEEKEYDQRVLINKLKKENSELKKKLSRKVQQ